MRHGLRSLAIAAGAIAGASGGLVSRPHAFSASAPAAISRRASSVHASVAISKPPLPEVVERAPATHPAFELVRVEMVDEYTIKVATYRHRQSGAEVISAQADDENKVFGIAFRTPVEDSTGVPHILEHSVLCGSAKYTSKEPFTELLKGSLQTFLNAFTYPDRTCYPVASCNTKDFYNLVNVYLDAVLSPRAKRDPTVFAQEGWHYELDAAEEPLTYKGAVFRGRYAEIWGDMGRYGPRSRSRTKAPSSAGDMGRCGEIWGDMGRYGEIRPRVHRRGLQRDEGRLINS